MKEYKTNKRIQNGIPNLEVVVITNYFHKSWWIFVCRWIRDENHPPCDETYLRTTGHGYTNWRPYMSLKTTYNWAHWRYNIYRAHQAASQLKEWLGGGPKGSTKLEGWPNRLWLLSPSASRCRLLMTPQRQLCLIPGSYRPSNHHMRAIKGGETLTLKWHNKWSTTHLHI